MHIVKALLRKGHHVHAVSIQEINIKGKLAENLTASHFNGLMDIYEQADDYKPAEWETYTVPYTTYFTYFWGVSACEHVVKLESAKKLVELVKTVEFDVIVQDITLTQCLYGLWEIAKNKPPIVGYIPFGPAPWLKDFIGGPSYPTIRPYTHAEISKPEGLWLRTWNSIYYVIDDLVRHYYFIPVIQPLAETYVGQPLRPLHEIERDRLNMVLLNTYSAFESPIPLPPNTLEIAGLNAQTVQPIAGEIISTYPENIRKFLDEAEHGVIVISLGTNVKWKSLGLDKIKSVLLALSQLKQRIIWKLDIELPYKIPNNVMIVKWIPQNEILSHKNVRAVWTHGGLLSAQEAIWKGVPMIVMPFFMDQKSNTRIITAKGVGIYLDIKTLSTQSVLHAVEEILYNESYARTMKQLSSQFRDRPIPPLDLAIWSIEYTVRHPNRILVTPLKYQSKIEQNLIDVYAILFFILVIILLSVFYVIKLLINTLTASKRKSKQA
ncbi:hypothetical protein PUN28_001770 [Cardiocondyla obscurior]